ncbi:MAG: EVE domain-containing protein [Gemmatimonadota bacterium]|nr:EVE domain-containing protein [Gemmatimonadota bacterium]MDH3479823.1 EVE domain-containing protein [Gemmatimonadota bacterium]MDH3569451.1 EVE domain-containing protein [Gemmatimonadota bacterium]
MPNYWILKTEPSTYSFDDLEREKSTRWDGVRNNLALKHIRTMRSKDPVLIYHTGKDKAVVGEAEVTTDPYPDPEADDERIVVIDLRAAGRLPNPVTLSAIKSDPAFKDLALVRMGRLSVVPATKSQWQRLRKLAGR